MGLNVFCIVQCVQNPPGLQYIFMRDSERFTHVVELPKIELYFLYATPSSFLRTIRLLRAAEC